MAVAPVLRQVVRVVRRLVRDVGEEGLAVAAVGIDEADQLVGVGLRGVVVVGQLGQVAAVFGEHRLRRRRGEVGHVPVAAGTVEQREVALEAARPRNLVGRLAQVPLADHVGVVARVLEQLRQRGDTVVEVALVAEQAALVGRRPLVHVAQTVEVRVDAAEQHRARWRAAGMGVEVGEAHAGLGQRIQVRRVDLTAERAHVGKAHVVGQDEHDVGPARRIGRQGGGGPHQRHCQNDEEAHAQPVPRLRCQDAHRARLHCHHIDSLPVHQTQAQCSTRAAHGVRRPKTIESWGSARGTPVDDGQSVPAEHLRAGSCHARKAADIRHGFPLSGPLSIGVYRIPAKSRVCSVSSLR